MQGTWRKEIKETRSDGWTFQVSHQAISSITFIVSKSDPKEIDKKIVSFFYENGISFNADLSRLHMHTWKKRAWNLTNKVLVEVIKPLSSKNYLGSRLAKLFGATKCLNTKPSSVCLHAHCKRRRCSRYSAEQQRRLRMHIAQGQC